MSLRILHPGTFSLLVDGGRPRSRSLGVPVGGAADRAAYRIGNALVGNRDDAVALEISFSGPTLLAQHDVSACLFGSPLAIQIDGRAVDAGRVFQIRAGETLKIGGTIRGARAYLCVRGGFVGKPILSSYSAFTAAAEGEILVCEPSNGSGRSLETPDARSLLEEPSKVAFRSAKGRPFAERKATLEDSIRTIDGLQADWFSPQRFYEQIFTVSPASNRMGVRLHGEALDRQPREMVSEAVAPGAVQVTNEGVPIVLGIDGQTIGGYPKIAHVIRADLDLIAQLRPGQSVRFVRVGIEEAEALAERYHRQLRHWLTALQLSADAP